MLITPKSSSHTPTAIGSSSRELSAFSVVMESPAGIAPTSILGAQQWQDEIGRALLHCNWFLLVLSKNSLESKWVKRELAYALEDDRYNEHILSVVKTPGDYRGMSWTLSSFQRLDFFGDFDDACVSLLRVWGVVFQPD